MIRAKLKQCGNDFCTCAFWGVKEEEVYIVKIIIDKNSRFVEVKQKPYLNTTFLEFASHAHPYQIKLK